jgi:hypothetical protein
MDQWPKIDQSNPDYQRDLASLQARGTGERTGQAKHDAHGDHHGGDEHGGH